MRVAFIRPVFEINKRWRVNIGGINCAKSLLRDL